MLIGAVCSFTLWQTLVCAQTIVCLFLNRQFSVRPPAHPRVGTVVPGGGGGEVESASMVCARGRLCRCHELEGGRVPGVPETMQACYPSPSPTHDNRLWTNQLDHHGPIVECHGY